MILLNTVSEDGESCFCDNEIFVDADPSEVARKMAKFKNRQKEMYLLKMLNGYKKTPLFRYQGSSSSIRWPFYFLFLLGLLFGNNCLFSLKGGENARGKKIYPYVVAQATNSQYYYCDNTFPINQISWKSGSDGNILLRDQPFHIKGINWQGLESSTMMLGGLVKRTLKEIFDLLQYLEINALRIPISLEFALSDMATQQSSLSSQLKDEKLRGLSSWQVLDEMMREAMQRGILIMLDMHSLEAKPINGIDDNNKEINHQNSINYDKNNPGWVNMVYTEEDYVKGWFQVIRRYKTHWNLFAIDIKNECNLGCTWGTSDPNTDYNKFVENMIISISETFPEYKGLFVVQGVTKRNLENMSGPALANIGNVSPWSYSRGGNLEGSINHPIFVKNFAIQERIVYSPHIYGPDLEPSLEYFNNDMFRNGIDNDNNHQNNRDSSVFVNTMEYLNDLELIWNNQYAWIERTHRRASIIGSWGGSMAGKDGIVNRKLADFLIKNCMNDAFWWTLNPTESEIINTETGQIELISNHDGLVLSDWFTISKEKIEVMTYVQPYPSFLSYNLETRSFCFVAGHFTNLKCDYGNYYPPPRIADQNDLPYADPAYLSKYEEYRLYLSMQNTNSGGQSGNYGGYGGVNNGYGNSNFQYPTYSNGGGQYGTYTEGNDNDYNLNGYSGKGGMSNMQPQPNPPYSNNYPSTSNNKGFTDNGLPPTSVPPQNNYNNYQNPQNGGGFSF